MSTTVVRDTPPGVAEDRAPYGPGSGGSASEWQLEVTAMTTPAGVRLCGEVDISTLPTLELALEMLVDRARDATIDLRELTFIDVCGLRALARAAIQLRFAGRCLRLRGASTQTRRVLSLLGWAELFELRC
jgi:anti-anti-sigma factor